MFLIDLYRLAFRKGAEHGQSQRDRFERAVAAAEARDDLTPLHDLQAFLKSIDSNFRVDIERMKMKIDDGSMKIERTVLITPGESFDTDNSLYLSIKYNRKGRISEIYVGWPSNHPISRPTLLPWISLRSLPRLCRTFVRGIGIKHGLETSVVTAFRPRRAA